MMIQEDSVTIANETEARRAMAKLGDLTNRILYTSNTEEVERIGAEIEIVGDAIEAWSDQAKA